MISLPVTTYCVVNYPKDNNDILALDDNILRFQMQQVEEMFVTQDIGNYR